ncbi:MAG: histidine--tRNA ligase [Deltaproteobacteria bacterium]|nr:histidine--tRNA ligase [Deltaproteobacteria bacterium]
MKGFKDILPEETPLWQWIEKNARDVFRVFGFKEIRTPLLEWTELFTRGIGEETDIVSKEMYTLSDSKGRNQTLRPEATASVVRAYIEHRLYQFNPVQKLFSIGPMFRHERPQKGRFRQFHQINAELFGDPGPQSDAELINMAMHIFQRVGLNDVTLNINSLGCASCRGEFKSRLTAFLSDRSGELCGECLRRSELNPLRVFDCKIESCRSAMTGAPLILDYLCDECRNHFNAVKQLLDDLGIKYEVNRLLVRGLDYYSRSTFEIQTSRLGAQSAVAGGGRYDGLVSELDGPPHSGMGFAIGFERLAALLEEDAGPLTTGPDLFIIALGDEAFKKAFLWTDSLRKQGVSVEMEYDAKGLKAQMKRADKLNAKRVLIAGEDELSKGRVVLRDMETKKQEEIGMVDLIPVLVRIILQ